MADVGRSPEPAGGLPLQAGLACCVGHPARIDRTGVENIRKDAAVGEFAGTGEHDPVQGRLCRAVGDLAKDGIAGQGHKSAALGGRLQRKLANQEPARPNVDGVVTVEAFNGRIEDAGGDRLAVRKDQRGGASSGSGDGVEERTGRGGRLEVCRQVKQLRPKLCQFTGELFEAGRNSPPWHPLIVRRPRVRARSQPSRASCRAMPAAMPAERPTPVSSASGLVVSWSGMRVLSADRR